MPFVNCSFCDHANPVDAKFCNECGAGLGLRPCAQCEAINDVSATYCHNCGAPLAAAAATAVTGAAQAEGGVASGSPALIRPLAPVSGATDASAPPPDVAGTKPAPASPRELASAAERLDAFWRDSMQAVEVARAMKGESAPAAPRSVDMLPLRVMDDTSVIDAGADAPTELRRGPRLAIAAALLVVAIGVVYYGYDRASNGNAIAPTSAPIAITAPPAEPANPRPAAAASTSTANSVPSAPATTAVEATPPAANPSTNAVEATPPAANPSTNAVEATPLTANARQSVAVPAGATSNEATGASIQTNTPNVATTTDVPPAPDSSPTAVRANDGSAAQPQAGPTRAGASGPAAVVRRAPAGDARNRLRNPRAAAPPTRFASPATRRPAAPSIIAPAPVMRPPRAPADAATCSDSTAALGLCRR